MEVLLPKIRDDNPRVSACVLEALGELVQVGQGEMMKYADQLLPLIIETLQVCPLAHTHTHTHRERERERERSNQVIARNCFGLLVVLVLLLLGSKLHQKTTSLDHHTG
jgi:type VI protein secretion system component VasF